MVVAVEKNVPRVSWTLERNVTSPFSKMEFIYPVKYLQKLSRQIRWDLRKYKNTKLCKTVYIVA